MVNSIEVIVAIMTAMLRERGEFRISRDALAKLLHDGACVACLSEGDGFVVTLLEVPKRESSTDADVLRSLGIKPS